MFSDPSNAPNFVSTIQFEDEGSVVTALLLEGAIVDSKPISVCRYSNQIEQNHEFQEILKDKPFKSTGKKQDDAAGTISGRLAKMKAAGYNLGQNAFVKAQAFDEKHSVTSSAKSVASSVASTASSAGKKGLQIVFILIIVYRCCLLFWLLFRKFLYFLLQQSDQCVLYSIYFCF